MHNDLLRMFTPIISFTNKFVEEIVQVLIIDILIS